MELKMNEDMSYRDQTSIYFKEIEKQFDPKLDPSKWWVVRLDGNSFSKLTKNYAKPFDEKFTNAMIEAAKFVLEYACSARLAYVQSDEISVVFEPNVEPFLGGRIAKLCSLMAGEASTSFTLALEDGRENPINPINVAKFDARAFELESKEEVLRYLWWRQDDCMKNAGYSTQFWRYVNNGMSNRAAHKLLENNKGEEHFNDMMLERRSLLKEIDSKYVLGRTIQRKETSVPLKFVVSPETLFDLVNKFGKDPDELVVRNQWSVGVVNFKEFEL